MKKLLYYFPFHFIIFLSLGIYIQFHTNFWKFGFEKLIILQFFIFAFVWISSQFKKKIFFTISVWILIVFTGICSTYFHNDKNYKNYYEYHLKNNFYAIFKIEKILKKENYYDKYQVTVSKINQQKTFGKILLNIQKDSLQQDLKIGDYIFLKPIIQKISPPFNPYEFSYKKYLKTRGIYKQVFVKRNQYKKIKHPTFFFRRILNILKNKIQSSLQKYDFSKKELSIINALLLGERQNISKKLTTQYSDSGVIHILAISGLHIGLLAIILGIFFKPLEKFKKGKIIKVILILLCLWSFAFLANLSTSVVRAVVMFTFMVIGESFERKKIIEHSIIGSMFFLLISNPLFLFDVGFQLSYLAIFGIIWIQPKLYNLWTPKIKILNIGWKLITVSIATQITVLPISLYYFHEFPGLFLVSNLIILPFLGIILTGGIFVIFFSLLGVLPLFIAKSYGFIIFLMNQFVWWISNQQSFLFKEIYISFWLMIAFYGCIIFSFLFFMNKQINSFFYLLLATILIQSIFIFEKYKRNTKQEFIVFHKKRKSIIGNKFKDTIILYSDLDSFTVHHLNAITSYRISQKIKEIYRQKTPSIFKFKNTYILLVDSLGTYELKHLYHPIVILKNSPKINLNRLIKTLHPLKIIADGSNYKNDILRWEKTSKEEKISFYATSRNGAFILY